MVCFSLSPLVTRQKKTSSFVSLPSSKPTIFLILFTKIVEIVRSRALFDWVSLNQNKTNHNGQSRKWLKWQEANGNSELSKCLKRGKTQVTKSWLVLVRNLIGWESGTCFLDQSQRLVDLSRTKTIPNPKPSNLTEEYDITPRIFSKAKVLLSQR